MQSDCCHQNAPSSACTSQSRNHWALLALRIAVGIIFIMHGYGKLYGGMEGFTGMVTKIGFPLPVFFAYAAAISEFLGGILILLGLWTKIASIFIGIVMFVALVFAKKFKLPMADVDLSLLASVIAIHLMGPGKFSLEAKMSARKKDAS